MLEAGRLLESCRFAMQSGGNQLGFALRNFLNWQPLPFVEVAGSSLELTLRHPESLSKARGLLGEYDLSSFQQRASSQRVLEALTYLEWLDAFYQALPQAFRGLSQSGCLNWLDVGAKNWAYVDALDAFSRKQFQGAYRLDGVELDAHRRYQDFTTRSQAANAYIQPLPHAQYHEMDVLHWRRTAHIVSHFLPFVLKNPHLAWGLPLHYFQPHLLLLHVLGLLEPGGVLLVVNQGEWEAEAQQRLWEQAAEHYALEIYPLGVLPTSFVTYRYPRYGWICVKQEF
ncbi:hypothetical protein [Vampirovibrio sp.]|uniref:hypothetical protein n=1 Tax=Vampirovibrio sp. TaxID=2717857 RepID=UPI00359319D2